MCDLPSELAALILDWSTVVDLVNVSHVSRLWRLRAQAHPTYWKRIRLTHTGEPSLAFFVARLALGGVRDCELTLDIYGPHSALAVSCVVEALQNHLPRITDLGIAMGPWLSKAIFPCLCAPAPRLHSLTLAHHPVSHPNSIAGLQALPAGIFGGESTTLRSAVLDHIKLGPSPPPALAGINSLRVSVCYRGALPLSWLYDLKNLDDLFIYTLSSTSFAHPLDGARLRHITHLALMIDDRNTDDAPVRACSGGGARWLAANLTALPTALFLLGQLRGPLHVRARCDPLFSLEYHAPEQGLTRAFSSWREAGPRADIWLYDRDDGYFGGGLAARITQLRLPTSCLAIGALLPPLPAVTRLVLDVVAEDAPPLRPYGGARLALPRLATVVLSIVHWPLRSEQRESLVRFLAQGISTDQMFEYETETSRVGDVSPLREAFLKSLFDSLP